MTEQYRLSAPQCPLCAGLLEERPTPGAIVDICADCHAVWIDWFDGDIAAVAAEVRVRRALPAGHQGNKACPRCHVDLTSEQLRGHGPSILRCSECQGVLVPSAVLSEVVALGPVEDVSPAEPSENFLSRLLGVLRRVVS